MYKLKIIVNHNIRGEIMKKMIGYTMLGMGLGASMSFMYDKYKNNSLKSTFQKAGNKVSNMIDSIN